MSSPNTIFVFCDRDDQAARLSDLIQQAGFGVRIAADPASMSGGALRLRPAAVVIDNAEPANVDACLAAVKRLFLDGRLSCPAIYVGDTENVEARLEAVRSGCSSFLARPIDPLVLIDTIDNLVAPETDPLRVLIIDDSRTSALHHAGILEDAGMVTNTVNDPMAASRHVESFAPDLILLDLMMPQCDGMEVAALIRQFVAYDSVPIVFLSGEASRTRQLDALDSGGDDFLTKPIDGAHLVRSARSRGMRFRRLARLIHRDAMTGLFSHSACLDKLRTELAFSNGQNVIAFAMADIDHFKAVNDAHGHGIGDLVIKALSRLLVRRLRKTDIVGRLSGEEFGVIMPGTDQATAQRLMEMVLNEFCAMVYHSPEGDFNTSFSCGVSDSSRRDTVKSLTADADQALYVAKNGGRNRVVTAA